jgi:hypothetical protein
MQISEDATLADLVDRHTLNKPEPFIRQVVEHMHDCRRRHNGAWLRIGVTGEGRAPNYRLEYMDGKFFKVFAAYNGLSHKQTDYAEWDINLDFDKPSPPRPDRLLRGEHWSSQAMELEAVAALLGAVRRERRR